MVALFKKKIVDRLLKYKQNKSESILGKILHRTWGQIRFMTVNDNRIKILLSILFL